MPHLNKVLDNHFTILLHKPRLMRAVYVPPWWAGPSEIVGPALFLLFLCPCTKK